MERVLKMSLRTQLEPWVGFKFANLWVTALLRMGVGTLRRLLLLSQQFRASLDEGGSLEQNQGPFPSLRSPPSLPALLHHTAHVSFFASFP